MRTVRINGKRYRWNPERMNGAALIGLYLGGAILAAFGFWALAALLVVIGG